MPAAIAMASADVAAAQIATPLPISTNIQTVGMTSTAIMDRSMPRPMITIAIPRPRTPMTATPWSRVRIFPGSINPLRKMEKRINSTTAIASTMRC